MAIYGYARVSSNDQNTSIQEQALALAGCDIVRSEKVSGTSRKNRTELKTLLDFIRKDDVLVVTRIDRLARSIGDLQIIISELKAKGASLRCIEQPVDTSTSAGKAFLDMLGVFAEFETNLRRERQMEGIKKPKRKGDIRDASLRRRPRKTIYTVSIPRASKPLKSPPRLGFLLRLFIGFWRKKSSCPLIRTTQKTAMCHGPG